jgi:hypothetical protein
LWVSCFFQCGGASLIFNNHQFRIFEKIQNQASIGSGRLKKFRSNELLVLVISTPQRTAWFQKGTSSFLGGFLTFFKKLRITVVIL